MLSRIIKEITVCGASLITAGVYPFHSETTPSALTSFLAQSTTPLNSPSDAFLGGWGGGVHVQVSRRCGSVVCESRADALNE